MESKLYKRKLRSLVIYLLLYLPIVIICSTLTGAYKNSLNSITLAVGVFGIQCSLFYYKFKNKNYLYWYTLLYIFILSEHLANWILDSYNLLNRNDMIIPMFIRGIFLVKIYRKSDIPEKWNNKKGILLSLTIIISIVLTFCEGVVNIPIVIKPMMVFIYVIFTILSEYLVIKILIRAIRERDFVNTIYCSSIIVMTLRLVMYFILYKEFLMVYALYYDKILFFTSFLIPIYGLVIEFKYILVKNIKLNNEMEEMKKIDDLKSNFFANLAHELKTPVNIIFSCVQYLEIKKEEKNINFTECYDKYNSTLKQNCYRIIRLINNIVDMTKINMGYFKVEFRNLDIVSVVENITLSVIPYVRNNNINIIFDTTIEELVVKCCPECMERIMLNLLSNSIKYTNDNGKIEVLLDYDKDNVIIRVKDTGTGIPKDKQANIFDVFVQGDVSLARQKEGSGIGLSIVKSLVELHDGNIYINKSSSKGTEMVIKIPNKTIDEKENMHESMNFTSNDLITKINIEFSDIYDIR